MREKALPVLSSLLLAAAIGSACTDASPETKAPPGPESVLEKAAETMGTVEGVRFTMQRSGAPVYIDTTGLLEFVSADGLYAAPAAAEALVTVNTALGLTTKIGAVVIEGRTWLTNPVTGRWEPAPEGYAFDPATLFDPAVGWRPLLREATPSVELVAEETFGSDTLQHLRVVASGERIEVMTAGLVSGDSVVLDLWVEPDSGEVREARFTTPSGDEQTEWRLTLTDYGSEVEITPPDLEGGG